MDEIYIIIDTNAWIYMCNGHEFKNEELRADAHIKIFEALKKLTDDDKIVVLINDLIIAEWERNIKKTEDYIQRLESQVKEKTNFIKNKHPKEEQLQARGKVDEINACIKKNQAHIVSVKEFLYNQTKKYNITDSSKIISADQAIAKKAPFSGKKSNSMADMVILLSGIEYIKDKYQIELFDGVKYTAKNYFVSANTTDFAETTDKTIINNDIAPFLQQIEMLYRCNLGILINELSEELILTDDDILDFEEYYNEDHEPCPSCDSDKYAFVVFYGNNQLARDLNYPIHDTKQLRLDFDNIPIEVMNKNTYVPIEEGRCCCCGGIYIKCVYCDELIDIFYGEDCQCDSCDTIYRTKVITDKKGEIKDVKYTILKNECLS